MEELQKIVNLFIEKNKIHTNDIFLFVSFVRQTSPYSRYGSVCLPRTRSKSLIILRSLFFSITLNSFALLVLGLLLFFLGCRLGLMGDLKSFGGFCGLLLCLGGSCRFGFCRICRLCLLRLGGFDLGIFVFFLLMGITGEAI